MRLLPTIAAGLASVLACVLIAPRIADSAQGPVETTSAVESVNVPVAPAERDDPLARAGTIRGLAHAGFVFSALSITAMVGTWLAFFPQYTGHHTRDVWIPMLAIWGGTGLVASPLLLSSNILSRKARDLKPVDGLEIASWILYGIAYATSPLLYWEPILTVYYGSVAFTAALIRAMWTGWRALRDLEALEQSVVPTVMPLRDGMAVGVAGTF